MCGIFGAIGTNPNAGVVRALAIVNRERGEESLGFFDSNGTIVKAAGDPLILLPKFAEYIDRQDRWFLAGHTRFATHGARTDQNAHPFQFGSIIGSHNGIVQVPLGSKYDVDSQYLVDMLHRADGDYQAALANISGYWGLTWFDGHAFWIQAHDNTVSIGRGTDGVWYYSSDAQHLSAAAGRLTNTITLVGGQTIRFMAGTQEFDVMPPFVSTAPRRETKPWWKCGFAEDNKATTCDVWRRPRAWLEDTILDNLDYTDIEIADDFARQLGYGGLVDFMQAEGYTDVAAAVQYLEDNIRPIWCDNEYDFEAWAAR